MKDIVKAQKIIENRREAAVKKYDDLLEKLRADEKFDDELRRLSFLDFEIAKCEVFGQNCDDFIKERDDLKRKTTEYLSKKGIKNIDEPDYFCKKCKDRGYVGRNKCECLEKTRIEVNLDRNPSLKEIPESLRKIDYNFYGEKSAEYLKCAQILNNSFIKGDMNFATVTGKAGTGKTYLAEVCLKDMLYGGSQVAVINAVKLNRIFLEYHCAPLESKAGIWAELIEPDVLLLDDMGVESVLNNVTVQYFYELLTERAELKTIITSNLDLRGFENKYGQRIMSRLADKRKSMIISVEGRDYRIS